MVLVAVATLLGAGVQSATGFGFVLVLGPAMFAVLEPAAALTTLLCLAAALNLLVLFSERRPRQIRRSELTVLLAAAVPGLVFGVIVLEALSKPALQVLVGVAILAAVALQLRLGRRRAAAVPAHGDGGGRAGTGPGTALTGLLTGALTTTTGTNGPPMLLWLQHAGASPAEIRDSLASGFLTLNVAGATVLAIAVGERQQLELDVVAPLLALVVAGQILGRIAFERLHPACFRIAGLALVLFAGLASIVAGAIAA